MQEVPVLREEVQVPLPALEAGGCGTSGTVPPQKSAAEVPLRR